MATAEFNQVFRPIILVLRLVGLWPSESRSILYFVYGAVIFIIFSVGLTAVEFIQLIKYTESEKLTETMFMTLTDLAVLMKIINFFWRWHFMQELYKIARDFKLETAAEIKFFNERMRCNYWIVLLLFVSVNTAHMGAELKVIFTSELMLPFPAWYPSSWFDGGVKYWLTYAHNSLSHLIGSNIVCALDGFPTSLLLIVSVQMEIIGWRLKSLGHNGPQSATGVEKNTRNPAVGKCQSLERIKLCIQTHQQILELSYWSCQ